MYIFFNTGSIAYLHGCTDGSVTDLASGTTMCSCFNMNAGERCPKSMSLWETQRSFYCVHFFYCS